MRRRAFLAGSTALAFSVPARAAVAPRFASAEPFGPGTARDLARALAAERYVARPSVPQDWVDMTYDEYRRVWFEPKSAIWSGRADIDFEMDLFLPGLYFPRPVEVDVVKNGTASRIAFDPGLFVNADYLPPLPEGAAMGFSGLRLRHVYPGEMWEREFAVFQGASYLRAIGAAQHYGLSARGLAVSTGDPEGEEFPDFVRFWVEEPAVGSTTITVHALLDSPSVAGAYRIVIEPGTACTMEVECSLFPRVDLAHAGIAPLTSMFLYDQTNRPRFEDFRTAIHDSDGLLVWNGAGEMLWRPLANPTRLQVSSFVDATPRGFGLMQRARRFEDFGDLEAHYHERPSLWIEPRGDWGEGAVRLVEIPTDREIYDNVVAYWRPRDPLAAGEEHRFAYRMVWGREDVAAAAPPRRDGVARVSDSYLGLNFERDGHLVAIDFAAHPAFAEGTFSDLSVYVNAGGAETSPGILQRNDSTGGARLAFGFDPGDAEAVEMRAQVFRDGAAVTEVWLYRWTPA